MDPEYSLQDVVRCHLCDIPGPSLHCEVCNVHLCEKCNEKHLSDETKEHLVVPFKYGGSIPKFQEHSTKMGENDCAPFVSSEKREAHDVLDVDPEFSLQDVVRCHLCETPGPSLHCEVCNVHLCEKCNEKHLTDETKEHLVVPFKYRGSIPKFQEHSTKMGENDCAPFVSSEKREAHNVVDVDPEFSLQDVVRCHHLCETPGPSLHCEVCNVHLCEKCNEKHLSDETKEHLVVLFKYGGSIPKFQEHSTKMGENDCAPFVSSEKREAHDVIDVDSELSLQDVARCHLCETLGSSLHCEVCNVHLCENCNKKHLSGETKEHIVVPFKYGGSIPKFQKHSTKMGENDCAPFVSSEKREAHDVVDVEPEFSLQDVVRCYLCETPGPSLHCEVCYVYMCKICEKKHLSDKTKGHNVVPFRYRGSIPKCQKHSSNICERYCEKCKTPICELCVSSREHQAHDVVDISKSLEGRESALQRDLQDLEKCIPPKNLNTAFHTQVKKSELNKNFEKLKTSINKQEDLHRENDNNIQNLEVDRYEMDSKQMINRQQIYQSFNGLSVVSLSTIKTERHGSTMDSPGAESSSLQRPLLDVPRIITKINTKYKRYKLRSVSCLNDNNIWTCGRDKVIRLYNIQGELLKSIQTDPCCNPLDIAVTKSGNLVYTDYQNRTVNIVKNTQIQTMIRLQRWRPRGVCSSSSGDLLVFMYSDDNKQVKVVRYSGSTEKQSIQYDDKGQPLYSSGGYYKYICENRNLDICVSDNGLRAVVVVNQAGKLRFTYTGSLFTNKGPLFLVGITTDSQGRILTSDNNNRCIHILDQDGQFLHYIDNCDLRCPRGLCVDNRDNLLVTEYFTGKLKKIQY